MQNAKTAKNNEAGFTLVEIAVVIVIVALLIAGILAGKNLSRAGKLRGVMNEIEDIRGAFVRFHDKYSDLPGDMTDAESVFSCTSCNGNGNEQIVWGGNPQEGAMAWRHLQLAKMYSTSLMSGTGDTAVIGQNVPASKMPGGGYFVDYDSAANGVKNFVGFGAAAGAGRNDDPILKPDDAMNIDLKIDDGNASAGRIRSDNTADSTLCRDGNGNYNFQESSARCYLMIQLDTEL